MDADFADWEDITWNWWGSENEEEDQMDDDICFWDPKRIFRWHQFLQIKKENYTNSSPNKISLESDTNLLVWIRVKHHVVQNTHDQHDLLVCISLWHFQLLLPTILISSPLIEFKKRGKATSQTMILRVFQVFKWRERDPQNFSDSDSWLWWTVSVS